MLFFDGLTCRPLGADEQDAPAIGGQRLDEVHRILVQRQRLLEIDDVDLVALSEDEGAILGFQ
jgi:hypothetical protein